LKIDHIIDDEPKKKMTDHDLESLKEKRRERRKRRKGSRRGKSHRSIASSMKSLKDQIKGEIYKER